MPRLRVEGNRTKSPLKPDIGTWTKTVPAIYRYTMFTRQNLYLFSH